jgi:prevent-host-death family protein
MREVGAFEAKNKLGQLLDLVEQGEEITITRHGKEVARLVPPAQCATATRPVQPCSACASAPKGASSVASIGMNGKPSGTTVASEFGARQLRDLGLALQRRDYRSHPARL